MTSNRPIGTLARKELTMMFNSPATYVIAVVFLLLSGYMFMNTLFQNNVSTMDTFLRPMPLILTFIIPALMMRSFAEEYRTGTIEYLATLPLEDRDIVVAKYIAAMGLLGTLLAFTLVFPLTLVFVGRPDWGHLLGSYLALLGLSSFFAAIGIWASSITRNQVVAFIIGFFVCFLFFLLARIADFLPDLLATFVRAFTVETHFDALSRGVVDTRDLLYWASGTAFFLVATLVTVQSRRVR